MKVKDVMTQNVATVNRDDSVEKAAQLMNEYNVGSIPICDNNKVVGVITDRDIALRSVAKGLNNNIKVGDIMTSNPVVANKDMDIHDAARIMSERQIRRLPVEDNENIIGIVSLGDIAIEPKYEDEAQKALSGISEQNN
ncbi:CBS domain-containing protein [Clostridium tepidum]|uniref:CBS domain-containing protein n=1 Tax=Clostridium tepidum TaxID=1962263 RepID=A0A1S9IH97_9CLOT|nr:CBS domain-containing protein [Clostridium tepidum]MCR1935125.1 CBS domain-containing protein [Clostridium tepidum]MDU6877131.1 CBS domain-containing protein [Clostridium botulinum]OOO63000.1 CBS domain-containing protein [Clostridium tepidum]OOO69575.1 CBS domain-containing protein [Clostridium tepidum]